MPHTPNSFTGKLIQYKQFDKYTKNCYRMVDRSVRRRKKNKTLLKNIVIEGRRNRAKKEKRDKQREKSMRKEEAKGGDSEGVRREKK